MMRFPRKLWRLSRNNSGLAAVEFALTAPLVLTLFLAGAEVTNFAITKMRVSQVALHVADNASRIGTNSLLSDVQISETQINDLFIGAALQAGSLDLKQNARIILSSVEAVANPNTTKKFKVRWQRCYGDKAYVTDYKKVGDAPFDYMGPVNQKVTTPDDTAVMFVEVAYDYHPLIASKLVTSTVIKDIAAMTVRDQRDYDKNGAGGSNQGVYNKAGAPVSSCTA